MLTVVKVINKNSRAMRCCILAFNIEYIQQINVSFLLLTFEHVFVSWAQDKIHQTTSAHIK